MFNFIQERKMRKEMEIKMYMRQQKKSMEKIISNLDKSRSEIIARGKRAKDDGMIDQFKMLQNSLKFALHQKLTAEKTLLQLEAATRQRDIGQMQLLFEQTMQFMNKDMLKTSKSMNFAKLQKDYNLAMANFEQDVMKLDMFLEGSAESLESLTEDYNTVSDEEILKMFDEPSQSEEINNRLEKELSDLEKSLDTDKQ